MALAWFICPYKRLNPGWTPPVRYCAMDDFNDLILADGGAWSETEILGNCAAVKVRASAGTLTTINQAPGFIRLPKAALGDTWSDLTNAQRQAVKAKLRALGYPLAEIVEALGDNLDTITLGDALRFAARRRLKPRYDKPLDTIRVDGPAEKTRPIAEVDAEVQ